MDINFGISYDVALVSDPKERLLKESLVLFRRACNYDDAMHLVNSKNPSGERLKAMYMATSIELEKERNSNLDEAIKRYLLSKS